MNIGKTFILPILFCFSLLSFSTTFSQIQGLDVLGNKNYVEIPFKLEHGFIVVKAKLQNTISLNFIFDTGASNTILFDKELADLFDIEFERSIDIIGSDFSEGLLAHIARKVDFKLNGTLPVQRDVVFLDENILLIKEKLGININGIIGGSYFQNLIVQINYRKKVIRLYHPLKLKKNIYKGFEELAVEIKGFKPYLDCKTTFTNGDSSTLKYLLDSGASLPFLLHMDTHDMISLPDHVIRGSLGYGLSGIIMGSIGQIRELKMGSFSFPNMITNFQEVEEGYVLDNDIDRNGIIGNNMMRRFHIIIDYFHAKMYLKPIRKKKYSQKFDFDRSGLIIFAVGSDLKEFLIKEVLKESPAAKSDIRPGDTIFRLAGRSGKALSLEGIYSLLQRKTGKRVKIVIKRNNIRIKKEIFLEDLLVTNPKK